MKYPLFLCLYLSIATSCTSTFREDRKLASPSDTTQRLYDDTNHLSTVFARRNANNRDTLNNAGYWISERFKLLGYSTKIELVAPNRPEQGFNVIAERVGRTYPDEIVVVGAHYDAEVNTPGADDNASGVAAMLELARRFAKSPQDRTIRWVGFTNEETSNSAGGFMGSFVHARNAKGRDESIVAMMSLEMLGYYDSEPGSQQYPFDESMASRLGMTLPDTGDFIGVVGRFEDRDIIESISRSMRATDNVNVVEAALPAMIRAIWRSDHGNFWLAGYNAVMITDTSEFRTPHYHKQTDTVETLDFERMSGVVDGLEAAVRDLATTEE